MEWISYTNSHAIHNGKNYACNGVYDAETKRTTVVNAAIYRLYPIEYFGNNMIPQ